MSDCFYSPPGMAQLPCQSQLDQLLDELCTSQLDRWAPGGEDRWYTQSGYVILIRKVNVYSIYIYIYVMYTQYIYIYTSIL